ncbi:MAG: serine kinase [Caulobacter sp.]|jgi:serine kinase of HPr protein (carbohydrate metabolism regulator)|nr:serine kinase [Caulobacter sp.]
MIRHAGLLALRLDGRWRGALIEGPSGIGKSDLALRALDQGFSLVADDRVLVFESGGRLFGRAPDPLAGLIEARGVGILPQPALGFCEIVALVCCQTGPDAVERLPSGPRATILGHSVAVFDIWPLEVAAPGKLRRILDAATNGRIKVDRAASPPRG